MATAGSSGTSLSTITGDQITVSSMELFDSENKAMQTQAEKAIEYATALYYGIKTVNEQLHDIADNLTKLKKVKVNQDRKITVGSVNTGRNSTYLFKNMPNTLTENIIGFEYAELLFKKYDGGYNLTADEEAELDAFSSFFQNFNDYNGFWVTESIAEIIASKFPALGAMVLVTKSMAYATDVGEGGDFIVGDGCKYLAQKLYEKAGSKLTELIPSETFNAALGNFIKYGSGTAAVAIFEVLLGNAIRKATDSGDWTYLDQERSNLDATGAIINYAMWNGTTDILVACGASTGPAGIAAAGISLYYSMVFDCLKDCITGDEIVEYCKIGNNFCPIPANGNGKNGTYDVILEQARDQFNSRKAQENAHVEEPCEPTEPPTEPSTEPTEPPREPSTNPTEPTTEPSEYSH